MKYVLVLGLIAFVNFACGKTCENCVRYERGDETFGVAVHLLNRTLASFSATEEGPFFKLVQTNTVDVLPYYEYPTINADLEDNEKKVQRCDVTLNKALDAEDYFTNTFETKFDCDNFKLTKQVTLLN